LAVPVRAMAAQATLGALLRLLQLPSAAASATLERAIAAILRKAFHWPKIDPSNSIH
jgi:hypothetical protein